MLSSLSAYPEDMLWVLTLSLILLLKMLSLMDIFSLWQGRILLFKPGMPSLSSRIRHCCVVTKMFHHQFSVHLKTLIECVVKFYLISIELVLSVFALIWNYILHCRQTPDRYLYDASKFPASKVVLPTPLFTTTYD